MTLTVTFGDCKFGEAVLGSIGKRVLEGPVSDIRIRLALGNPPGAHLFCVVVRLVVYVTIFNHTLIQ